MNIIRLLSTIALGLIICVIATVQAGGDKSAKTTVITLAGGGEKSHSNYIPIPIPVCAKSFGHSGGHHGGYHGGYHGARARMDWRRR